MFIPIYYVSKETYACLPAYTVKWGEFSLSVAISIREYQQKTFVTFRLADFGCKWDGWGCLSEFIKIGKFMTQIFFG